MAATRLTPDSFKTTNRLLSDLLQILKAIPSEDLSENLISYVFLPMSSILQRNSSSEIPDQILEKILRLLSLLMESWWWTCDLKIWEQVFILCGAIVGGIERRGGKGKTRDDETREAAVSSLSSLLRPRTPEEAIQRQIPTNEAEKRLEALRNHAQSSTFIPIIGQTLDSLLNSSTSPHSPLQHISLDVVSYLIDVYLPDPIVPSVLPGVVSTMSKVCLGVTGPKGWANGEIVFRALYTLQVVTVRAVNDEVCIEQGALQRVKDLDDLANLHESTPATPPENTIPFGTARTESWLRGTATQLHIAINSLTSLLSHPNAKALRALTDFSAKLLHTTSLALPQTQPLLVSFLLSLSLSEYASVSARARQSLSDLLSRPSDVRLSLQQVLMNNLGSNLVALPRLIATQTDAKVAHTAGLIEAVCRLASGDDSYPSVPTIAKGVGKILGPTGGIEKWGWSLLAVLEFVEPPIVVTHHSSAQLMLETDPESQQLIVFPELAFRNVSSYETRNSLVRMLHALGSAGGDAGLFAVEWFYRTGCSSTSPTSVAALWFACRLLEGIASVSVYEGQVNTSPKVTTTRRVERQSKLLARTIAEIWDQPDPTPKAGSERETDNHSLLVQHQRGLVPLHQTLKIIHPTKATPKVPNDQPILHRALCLQLLAVAAGINKERFSSLFIHTLYPVLHSLVSPMSFLSATALATLNFITVATSYASPANLLLSNFDYVLDSVSRRLTQRWLDIDATKVLGIMIRLVGADIVERAADVVEECFDRLDQFHGYGVIVDGLIEVLNEVLKVIETEAKLNPPKKESSPLPSRPRKVHLDDFFAFLPKRFDNPHLDGDNTDYGPAPRVPWGKTKENEDDLDAEDEQLKPVQASDEPPLTVVQSLTKQIISRSIYFLTHDSAVIRAKILNLLKLAVPVLPESLLLPTIHDAWPFILNRLSDSEPYVVSADAELVEALAEHVGDFMFRRIWDDIWPKFRSMLRLLETADATSALSRRGETRVGTESAYTHSHRLYRSLLRTMTVALKGVHQHGPSFWEVIVAFRRFLSSHAHEELQQYAINLYVQAGKQDPDAVWLLLTSTVSDTEPMMAFLKEYKWEMDHNVQFILQTLE